jgi:hypothetical protein
VPTSAPRDGSLAFLAGTSTSEILTISFRGMRPLSKADPFGHGGLGTIRDTIARRSLTLSAQEFAIDLAR